MAAMTTCPDGTMTGEDDPRAYYALQDANFNVTELYDAASGGSDLVERYSYDPYGVRQVYAPADGSDVFGTEPIAMSSRFEIGGVAQPYGLNDVGHQGLVHDESLATQGGLIYNRARTLHPRLGKGKAATDSRPLERCRD